MIDPRTKDAIRETTNLLASLKIDVENMKESLEYIKKTMRAIDEKVTRKGNKENV